ncbi:ABC transporter permease (plasmid) [Rhizobium sp. CB3060]|nr:ABC transporter permease [Rhizobium tropici]UWU26145.1 ABC transporter permease [Rhizobium tropici]
MSSQSSINQASPPKVRHLFGHVGYADLMLPLLILLLALVAVMIEPRFLSTNNLLNLLRQLTPLLIFAAAQGIVIMSGGLDLSQSSVLSVAGVAGVLVMPQLGIGGGVCVMIAVGAFCGLFSGFVVAATGASPLIVTLSALSITQAFALILANGVPIYDVPGEYTDLVGFTSLAGIPVMVLIGLAVLACCWVLLRFTVFGRYVYAMGSNYSAALHSGVDVRFYTVLVYVLSGTCAGIGAVVVTAWTSAAQPIAAPNLALQALASVVLGGVALKGGSGGMIHVVFGVVTLGMLSNVLNMIGVSAYFQTLAVGLVILLAVCLDRLRQRSARR